MNFKNYPLIGKKDNRKAYLQAHNSCEICNSRYFVAVHHHIKQQKAPIELDINYTSLCRTCHGILHANKNQFARDIKISFRSKLSGITNDLLYEYLNNLKSGESIEEFYAKQ